jgi:hypothetical protein
VAGRRTWGQREDREEFQTNVRAQQQQQQQQHKLQLGNSRRQQKEWFESHQHTAGRYSTEQQQCKQ